MRILLVLGLLTSCKKSPPAPAAAASIDAVEVIKGPLDQREYEAFVLPNGLRALAIHTDDNHAAAAFTVHRGYFDDPPDREGLTHFLEHMLFMGTDEFPEVDAYATFIESHGGSYDGSTHGESTDYSFTVEAEHLEGALDRFSRFFVAPLFDPHYVDRERNAVQSEFTLKSFHQARIQEVRKQTMNPAHPESQFVIGTLDTLDDREDDTVHARLLELHAKTFNPEHMTFAIAGNESLDTLKAWTIREFSDIPINPTTRPELPPPFLDEHLGIRIDLVPTDERRLLELHFPMAPEADFWPATPHDAIRTILGHEGEGTLFAELKAKGWIEALDVAGDASSDHEVMYLLYTLTEAGTPHIDDIVSATFDAIALIEADGLTEARHDERATRTALDFAFAGQRQVGKVVSSAAAALAHFPTANVLNHWAVPAPFDPDLVRRETLSKLTVDNARIVVTLPEEESSAVLDRFEERYAVKYGVRKLTEAEKATYTAPSGLDLRLPALNPYLPSDTTLLPNGDGWGIPNQLQAGKVDLWHRLDTSYRVPRAYTSVRLYSDATRRSGLKGAALARLYTRVLDRELQSFTYPLREAGLYYGLQAGALGLDLALFGFNDRQPQLLTDLTARIRDLSITSEVFERERRGLLRDLLNPGADLAIEQAFWSLEEVMDPDDHGADDLVPVLEQLTVDDLETFTATFLDTAHAQMFVQGNVTADDARSMAATVESTLLENSKPLAELKVERRSIPDGATVLRTLDLDHDDSTLVVHYQADVADQYVEAHWRMLGALVTTPFFHQIRTEQQLGYAVQAEFQHIDQLPGVTFAIQSPVADPITLLERVDTFLEEQLTALEEMPKREFKAMRSGVAAPFRGRENTLLGSAELHLHDLQLGHHAFTSEAVLAYHIEHLKKSDIVALWKKVFLGTSGRVIIRSFGNNHADENDGAGCRDEACVAEQLGTFRRDAWM